MNYASSRLNNISTILINRAISNNLSSNVDFTDMILVTKSDDNEIQMIDFNPKEVNKILNSITNSVLESLKTIETGSNEIFNNGKMTKYKDGIIYEIPIGSISNNLFFGNLGPKIPVKLDVIGDVKANIKTEVREYGINNALIEIFINVSVSERIIIPFVSDIVNVSCDVPVAIKIIQGNIPIYYGNGISKGSNILSIPTE